MVDGAIKDAVETLALVNAKDKTKDALVDLRKMDGREEQQDKTKDVLVDLRKMNGREAAEEVPKAEAAARRSRADRAPKELNLGLWDVDKLRQEREHKKAQAHGPTVDSTAPPEPVAKAKAYDPTALGEGAEMALEKDAINPLDFGSGFAEAEADLGALKDVISSASAQKHHFLSFIEQVGSDADHLQQQFMRQRDEISEVHRETAELQAKRAQERQRLLHALDEFKDRTLNRIKELEESDHQLETDNNKLTTRSEQLKSELESETSKKDVLMKKLQTMASLMQRQSSSVQEVVQERKRRIEDEVSNTMQDALAVMGHDRTALAQTRDPTAPSAPDAVALLGSDGVQQVAETPAEDEGANTEQDTMQNALAAAWRPAKARADGEAAKSVQEQDRVFEDEVAKTLKDAYAIYRDDKQPDPSKKIV